MMNCLHFSLLLALMCVHIDAVPVDPGAMTMESCEDSLAMGAARETLTKINQDRQEGYILALHRLSNAHSTKHGETGIVFYLTLDVVETNCSVLSKKDWKDCEARPTGETPVYGQCKAAIYINRVHRVVRLYKYNCVVRPVPAPRVKQLCPDCSSHISFDNAEVKKTVSKSLEKFNKESGLTKIFALLNITRATAGMAIEMYYHVEYTIQETNCTRNKDTEMDSKCPIMDCEFSHKGFCKASHFHTPIGDSEFSVACEIYEPEAGEREKKLHLLGDKNDHSHNDTHPHNHSHDEAHAADSAHIHDHVHDHTKSHDHHDKTHKHAEDSDHHHTHDHQEGSAHRHAHAHSHDHGHGHDHVHSHHAQAHDHSNDSPNHHHDYKHGGVHTHEHDHEISLDHDHKHSHLHEHEHHHHHHTHDHETTVHDNPEGIFNVLPAMDQVMTLPSFPDVPAGEVGVVLPLVPDPQTPGEMQPTLRPFPTSVSSQCASPKKGETLVQELFEEDPMFKPAA